MTNILEEGTAVLDAIAAKPMLFVFDFDGTLAPATPDATDAAMRCSTRALLRLTALLVDGRDPSA